MSMLRILRFKMSFIGIRSVMITCTQMFISLCLLISYQLVFDNGNDGNRVSHKSFNGCWFRLLLLVLLVFIHLEYFRMLNYWLIEVHLVSNRHFMNWVNWVSVLIELYLIGGITISRRRSANSRSLATLLDFSN